MSNGNPYEEVPNEQPASESRRERAGYNMGDRWISAFASTIERECLLKRLWEDQLPDLRQCRDGDHAIQELVRTILPPCGLHLDSAKEYWRLITNEDTGSTDDTCDPDFVSYIAGFLDGAVGTIIEMVLEDAEYVATEWMERDVASGELEHLKRFAEQYGDTWMAEFPIGCRSIFEVALYMMGRDLSRYRGNTGEGEDEGRPADPLSDFRRMLSRYGCDTVGTEEFARDFIHAMVALVRQQQSQTDEDRFGETGVGPTREDNTRSQLPLVRRPRGIRFRGVYRTASEPQDADAVPSVPANLLCYPPLHAGAVIYTMADNPVGVMAGQELAHVFRYADGLTCTRFEVSACVTEDSESPIDGPAAEVEVGWWFDLNEHDTWSMQNEILVGLSTPP